MPEVQLTNKDIAAQINTHLRRIEADHELNLLVGFLGSCASANGPSIQVCYSQPHGALLFSDGLARMYLDWLDAGNVGEHYDLPEMQDFKAGT